MASISRERVVLLLYLISDAVGNTLENKCKSTVKDKPIPVVSFCNEQRVVNSSITLDAFLPLFGASSSVCMCEVKILSTQTFSSLRISQESTLVPPGDCGLQLKIANATGAIKTVNCTYIGDSEYILYQGSSIVISLANISEKRSGGFCFSLSLRFENSHIRVQCFNPGVNIVPSQPFTTDTPTTSTTASAVTNTFSYPSTTTHDTSHMTSDVTPNVKSSTVTSTSSTESLSTTRTEFSQTTAILTSDSTSSGDVFSSTVTNTGKVESTMGVDTGTTTPLKTSSTGKEDVTSVKKVIYTSDFNVLYAVIPVIGVILTGILCLIFIWYRRRRDAKERLYSRQRLQTSTVSSFNETDTHPQNKAYRDTHTANHRMKNDPEFYYNDDQLTQQTTLYASVYKGKTSKENNPKRTSHYIRDKDGKDIPRSDVGLDQTARNTSRGGSNDTPVVYVTVNGGNKFVI